MLMMYTDTDRVSPYLMKITLNYAKLFYVLNNAIFGYFSFLFMLLVGGCAFIDIDNVLIVWPLRYVFLSFFFLIFLFTTLYSTTPCLCNLKQKKKFNDIVDVVAVGFFLCAFNSCEICFH